MIDFTWFLLIYTVKLYWLVLLAEASLTCMRLMSICHSIQIC